MRTLIFAFAGMLSVSWAVGQEQHDHSTMGDTAKPAKTSTLKQKTCPVTGKPIQEDVFVEQDGLKIYFSSLDSLDKFKESPGRYLPAVYKQIYPQTVQVKCLVSGDPVDPAKSVDFTGAMISFCCDKCPKDFEADPAKYLGKMKASSTAQVHCPVTGRPINPRISTQLGARTVYFNSKDALDAFKAAPTKYTDKLRPEAGVLARGATADDDLVLCAVAASGETVHRRKDVQTTFYRGKTYFLRGETDAKTFKADPAARAKEIDDKLKAQPPDSDQWFTCTMHPDVLQKGPGKCPKCGMNLTPVKPTGSKSEHQGHDMMNGQQGGTQGGMMQSHGRMMQGGGGGMMRGRGGMMQGHGGMMQGHRGMMQGQGDQQESQNNEDHPGCSPLGHEH